jgi:hypothetical protein
MHRGIGYLQCCPDADHGASDGAWVDCCVDPPSSWKYEGAGAVRRHDKLTL